MTSHDEPTQHVRRPDPPPAPLPGSLDPLRGHAEPEPTGVLPLDELFEPAPEPQFNQTELNQSAAAEASTWTAMPMVEVRSGTVGPSDSGTGWPSEPSPSHSADDPVTAEPGLVDRLRDDTSAAWIGVQNRASTWLRRDDNALMLLTAVVACILMLVVAAVGH